MPHNGSTHSAIFSRAKRILPVTREVSPEENTDNVIYLVCQGQQHVVEEDGGDRHFVVLAAALPHS